MNKTTLLGQSEQTIDDKNRVRLPSKFTSGLKGELIIARGLDGCLNVFPRSHWNRFIEELSKRSDLKKNVRQLRRFFAGWAENVRLDSQNRLVIPKHLREYAQLDGEIVILGVLDRIEIWNKKLYQEKIKEIESQAEALAEELVAE